MGDGDVLLIRYDVVIFRKYDLLPIRDGVVVNRDNPLLEIYNPLM
jgi:hypothetical protein